MLVNNAGLGFYGPFAQSTDRDWRRLFEINLFAPVFLTRKALPHLLASRGLIVNVGSIGGLVAHTENVAPYVAAKHALVGFSRALARDLAGTGVKIVCACPHLTDTGFFENSPGAEAMAEEVEKYRSFMDSPQDVARGIVSRLDSGRLVIFPTAKPEKSYQKMRDL